MTRRWSRVDFTSNLTDLRSLLLASLGFSTKYIKKQTKLTPGQIAYRLRKGQVKRADYRDGNSSSAKVVLSDTEEQVVEQVKKQLRKQELKRKTAFTGKKKAGLVA